MDYIDIHSHILPDMDDGACNIEDSMEMLRIAKSEGISGIIVTPHYKSGRFRADSGEIHAKLQQLQRAADAETLNIKLYTGTEIYYRSELEDKLEREQLCTMNETEFILVEFSPFEDYIYMRNAVNDVLSMGYRPILAHVERYHCMLQDIQRVDDLKSAGCGIQVNAGSITGDFGLKVKHYTHKLLKNEWIDYVGTDAHNTEGRRPAMQKCADIIYKKCSLRYAEAVLSENARRYLRCV